MKTLTIKPQHDITCDVCGHPIPAGTTCRMIIDEQNRRWHFEHLACPNGAPVILLVIPFLPLLSGALPLPERNPHFAF